MYNLFSITKLCNFMSESALKLCGGRHHPEFFSDFKENINKSLKKMSKIEFF